MSAVPAVTSVETVDATWVVNAVSPESDAALVLAARDGDQAALDLLLSCHLPSVTALCHRVGGTALADDCAQDALLLALLRLPQLREPAAFAAWLRGIALHVCHRARAQVGVRTRVEASADAGDTGDAALRALDLPAGEDLQTALTQALSTRELTHVVRRAVHVLPVGQRDAITHYYLAGQSYEETADALGVPISAVKTRLHKGRAALRHHLRLTDGPRPRRLPDRLLAQHEAAHAVVHWASGGAIRRLAITPRAAGMLGFYAPATDPLQSGPPHVALQVTMAGEAATARVVRRRPLPESGDRANAARLARIATGGDDVEAAVLISIALEAATDRLEDDATWQRVERVAEALVARRALDADEFRDLVRA